ncbi:carbohydrate ABC transporter permease [Deinococcus hopiensis]|uniref:Multiple sugar transport system permease protein n=1 Tax=Deinococcus hopiensis KR-140 TaxID=695939 RepID=A0A1W1UGQ9_9DEIO|nr:sugar ABC transporter permease [Deinococcus hopiensis]SMB80298.1 multiple sugar transport system permease protein [Deinococcus hopiensis KR-140]
MQARSYSARAAVERPSLQTRWNIFQRRAAPYFFISPFFILFLVFGLFPIVFLAYLSFQEWTPSAGLGTMKFVGWRNYTDNLTDPAFWSSLRNTVSLALLAGLPQHLIAIPLAFAINMGLRKLQGPLTAVYFVPYITSVVAISVTFFTLFSWQYGVVNAGLTALHHLPLIGGLFPAENINWLGERAFIQPAIAMVVVWRFTGWNVVLYLAGLQSISRDLYEAASVDGATRLQQFRFITLPLLRPMMFLAITLTIIGNLQLFEEPFILTNGTGGAGQQGTTAVMYMLRTYQNYGEAGIAAAMGWLLFVVIMVLTFINNRVFGREGVAGKDN